MLNIHKASSVQKGYQALICSLLVFLLFVTPAASLAQEGDTLQTVPSDVLNLAADNTWQDIPANILESPGQPNSDNSGTNMRDTSTPADSEATEVAPDKPSQATSELLQAETKNKKNSLDNQLTSLESSSSEPPAIFTPDDTAPTKTGLQAKSDQATGALNYEYPIYSPPGRLGMAPNITLKYNSQNQDNSSVVGYGWNLNIPYIQRQNVNGTNQLYSSFDFTSSLSGDLTPISSTTLSVITFGTKVETGDFLSYSFDTAGNKWAAVDKQGLTYTFGQAAGQRQDDPNNAAKIFKWLISSITDTNGNFTQFSYHKDQGQIYPQTITYTNSGNQMGIYSIEFARTPRADNLISFASAFRVQTNYLISQILVKSSSVAIRTNNLAYSPGANTVRSLLSSITETGHNPETGNTVNIPPVGFTYGASSVSAAGSWTVPVSLDNKRTRVGDVNGDGRVDILESYWTPSLGAINKVYINNGSGWTADANWPIPIEFAHQLIDGTQRVYQAELLDINGDSRADILSCTGSAGAVYINNSSGWDEATALWTGPCLYPNNSSGVGSATADLNGDGLVDYLTAAQSGESINSSLVANTGVGWNALASINSSTTPVALIDASGYDTGTRLFDINGDGLADLVQYQTYNTSQGQSPRRSTYLNRGDGSWEITVPELFSPQIFSDYKSTVPPTVISPTTPIFDINGDGFTDYMDPCFFGTGKGAVAAPNPPFGICGPAFNYARDGNGNIPWNLGDVNGDGLLDFISNSGVSINTQGKQDLLKSVTNSTGAVTSITYKPASQYFHSSGALANPNSSIPIYTAEKITITDQVNGVVQNTSYFYAGGKYLHDGPFDRQFAGFAEVTKTDSQGNKTVTVLLQADQAQNPNPFPANPRDAYNHTQSLIGKVAKIEIYDGLTKLYKRAVNEWNFTTLGLKRDFVSLAQNLTMDYDGAANHKDKAENYTYNLTNGNLTQKIIWGEVNGNVDGSFADVGTDKLVTNYNYATDASGAKYLVSSQITNDQNNQKIKESRFYYDNLPLGQLSKGNLTKQEDWKSGSIYINSQKVYNSYGLATSEIDPRGKVTVLTYDSFNLYPATRTNSLNHTTQFEYDYASGKIKKTTDPNGNIFRNTYDSLGRLILIQQPDLIVPSTLVNKTAFSYTDTPNAVNIKQTDYLNESQVVETYTYYDGLKRPIQTRKSAEAEQFIVTDTLYDQQGRIAKQSLPYYSQGTSRTSPATNNNLYTVYAYDALDRIISDTNSLGTTSKIYIPWQTTITDPKGISKDLIYDAYGRLAQVKEHNGAGVYLTEYKYDGADNLIKFTDALGNVRNFAYDGLSRRLSAEDLHASSDTSFGKWIYAYDDSGNLIQTVDPKNQTVNYMYDGINRVLSEDHIGTGGTEVTYAYDTCTQGKGRLCTVLSAAVNVSNSYNALGQLIQETKTINSKNYITGYTYDRQGNRLIITNPDNSQVKHTYNSANQIETLEQKEGISSQWTSLVSNFDYSASGKPSAIFYGNGTITQNTYDQNALYRLALKQTSLPASALSVFCQASPSLVQTGQTVTFTAQASGGNGPYSYLWNDGAWGTGASTVQTFSAPGLQTATVKVTDSSSPVKTQTTSCDARVVLPPFSDDFASADSSLISNWILYNGGGAVNTGIPGVFRLITSSESHYMQLKSQRNFYGELDVTMQVFDQNQGDTQVGLLNQDNSAWAARTILNGNPRFVTDYNDTGTQFSGNYKGQWVTVRIVTSGGQAKFYIDGLFKTSLQFNPGSNYKVAFVSEQGNPSTPHISDITSASVTENPLTSGSQNPPPPAGTLVQNLTYTYDPNGNITKITDNSATHSAKTIDYAYDDLNRLTSAISSLASFGGNYNYNYVYDAVGNMLSRTENGTTTAYSYLGNTGSNFANPHASTAIGTSALSYDNSGNLLANGAKSYAWDYRNQLIGATLGGSTTTTITATSTVLFYSTTGDGSIYKDNSSWATALSATTGSAAGYTGTTLNVRTGKSSNKNYRIERAFLPFDTSALPDDAVITDAKLKVYVASKLNNDNDGADFVSVVQTSQPSTSALATGDYDLAGSVNNPTEGIDVLERKDITNVSTGQYLTFNLNSTGRGWVSKTGSTKLGLREGHDATNSAFVGSSGQYNQLNIRSANYSGTASDPVLEVTYTTTTTSTSTAPAITYAYDHTGQRVKMASGAKTTVYPSKYFNTDGATPAKHIFAGDMLIATVTGSNVSSSINYIHTDHLSGSNVVTSATGAVVELLDYYPYGASRLDEKTGTFSEQRKYTGHEFDDSTGLLYANARYYQPSIGRFLSQDPMFWLSSNNLLLDPQNQNAYAYGRNNPANYADRTGELSFRVSDIGEGLKWYALSLPFAAAESVVDFFNPEKYLNTYRGGYYSAKALYTDIKDSGLKTVAKGVVQGEGLKFQELLDASPKETGQNMADFFGGVSADVILGSAKNSKVPISGNSKVKAPVKTTVQGVISEARGQLSPNPYRQEFKMPDTQTPATDSTQSPTKYQPWPTLWSIESSGSVSDIVFGVLDIF